MPRALPALLLAAGALAATPAAAAAATTCNYVPLTHRLSITGDDREFPAIVVGRSGNAIAVSDSGVQVDCTGGDPTVTNTDKIAFTDNSTTSSIFVVNLAGGPLAPGYSGEGQFGTPEIEIEVDGGDGPDAVWIVGGPAGNRVNVGTSNGIETHFNLNPEEPLDDADLVGTGLESVDILGGAGDDVLDGRGGAAAGGALQLPLELHGGEDDDTLNANDIGAVLTGDSGHDSLFGGSGSDLLTPGLEDDTAQGGGGNDTLRFDVMNPAGVRVDLADLGPQNTGEGADTLGGFESVTGTFGPDVLLGSTGDGTFTGLGGDDVLDGGSGDDVLEGGSGGDTVDYSRENDKVTVALAAPAPQAAGATSGKDTLTEVENVTGSRFGDSITGTDGPNVLAGRKGPDDLEGAGGDDTLDGGTGTEAEPDGSDVLDGGPGIDTLSYADRSGRIAVRLDGLKNEGADPDGDGISSAAEEGDQALGIEHVTGGAGPDRLQAFGNAVNVFLGRGGADRLNGGPGADTLDGGGGIDTVSYADRTARVAVRLDGLRNDGSDPDGDGFSTAGEENDRVLGAENVVGGSAGDRIVATGAAVNVLTGGPGPDFVNAQDGSSAADTLGCGTGADTHRSDPVDARTSCEVAG